MDTSAGLEPPGAIVDGRRLRREQGTLAVIDAMIDLVLEGHGPPTVEQVAGRAGVSPASLFRYFPTVDTLRQRSIERYFDRYDDLIRVADLGVGPLGRRIDNLVEARLRFYETTAPMARLARRQAAQVAELAGTLRRVRDRFADQVARQFAPELAGVNPIERGERLAVVAALTSFESWDLLQGQGFDREGVGRALRTALERLLGTGRAPPGPRPRSVHSGGRPAGPGDDDR